MSDGGDGGNGGVQAPLIDFKQALAGVVALGAGLAVLAGATGAFEQMQRNHPQWTALIFSGAIVAGFLVVAAGLTHNNRAELWLAVAGLAAFGLAALGGIILLIGARGERPPPSIQASFKSDPKLDLTGTVKVEQMTANETLKVRVIANASPGNNIVGVQTESTLYDAKMGSDESGNVDLPIDVPIPERKFAWVNVLAWISEKPDSCFGVTTKSKNTPGCVAMRLPEAAAISSG
jgi:hypothetical protein